MLQRCLPAAVYAALVLRLQAVFAARSCYVASARLLLG
jgi:hypothetical protein